jgi:hypothetical protein
MPFLVDSGTYTYRTGLSKHGADEPEWRRYLRGPEAHNGLALDGFDALGDVQGDFRRGELETFVSAQQEHDARVADWVDAMVVGRGVYNSHRRGVVQVAGEYQVVYDILPISDSGSRRNFGFQFAPECKVSHLGRRTIRAENNREAFLLVGSPGLAEPVILSGSSSPLGGWVSRRYGELVPAPQVRFEVKQESSAAAFLLSPGDFLDGAAIEVHPIVANGVQITIVVGTREDTLLINFKSTDEEIRSSDLTFRGRLVWVRSIAGKPSRMRWLQGSLFDWRARGVAVTRPDPCALEITADGGEVVVRHCDPGSLSLRWPQ